MEGEAVVELRENEQRTLLALEKLGGSRRIDQVVKVSGLAHAAVMRASLSLTAKKLTKVHEQRQTTITLNEEGKYHAERRLPERRLINSLIELGGEAPVEDVVKEAALEKRFLAIALGWLRKKGWASIEKKGRVLKALREPLTGADERLLSQLDKRGLLIAEELDKELQKAVSVLKRRKLVEIDEKTLREMELTKSGWELVEQGIEIVEEVGQLTPELIRTGKWREVRLKKYDVTLPSYPLYMGKRHFVRQVLEYIRRIWVEMGFKEMKGPIVETSFWDYDVLYVPQDHPARDLQDTFYMKKPSLGGLSERELVERVKETHETGWTTGSTGWRYRWDEEVARQCLLRTHTTSLSARTLAALREADLPAKFFSVGRVFRNEAPSWKSLCEFYQTDGIVVDENVNFRHLIGYLKRYFSKLGFEEARFRPAYFPYTEPSVEIEVYHPVHSRWMELGGAGMFRPEVVKALLGREIPVLAWGPGLGRMIMVHYGITDIRDLYSNDLKQLREAKIWLGE